jgi:hypothetical protein
MTYFTILGAWGGEVDAKRTISTRVNSIDFAILIENFHVYFCLKKTHFCQEIWNYSPRRMK